MATNQIYNFDSVIPWHILKKHLGHLEQLSNKKMLDASTHDDIIRAQAQSRLLHNLYNNLPEILKVTEEREET